LKPSSTTHKNECVIWVITIFYYVGTYVGTAQFSGSAVV
jgi:hypothetical protein